MQETALYAPIKAFLEGQGYEVKAEVKDCDLVAVRGEEPPVIVELKLSLSVALLMQGIDRQAITDAVYVAVPAGTTKRWRGQVKDGVKLCRRLGLGLISVRQGKSGARVEVHADPGPYKPRKMARRTTALLGEFHRRVGDPNTGGQTRQTIMTAYRQDAIRIADALRNDGPNAPAKLASALDIPKAASILQSDYYGWFERVSRGVYDLRPAGTTALEEYSLILTDLRKGD